MTDRDKEHFHVLDVRGREALVQRCDGEGRTSVRVCPVYRNGESMPPGEYLHTQHDEHGGFRVTGRFDTRGTTGAASTSYREGWDRIFGGRASAGEA